MAVTDNIVNPGYLGSSFIGAALIACGFDTVASKVACIVLAVFFIFTLWWARKNWLTWALIAGLGALIVLAWYKIHRDLILEEFLIGKDFIGSSKILWRCATWYAH